MRPDRLVLAVAIGGLFALGLGVSGMANPANVIGFLDLTGGVWNPALALVMGGALLIHAPLVHLARGRLRPWRGERFDWPPTRAIDGRLVAGAAVFGVGWGLSGYCPGPALVGVGSLYPRALVFVAAVAVGAMIGRAVQKK